MNGIFYEGNNPRGFLILGMPKVFSGFDPCSKNQIPPNPPFLKGGTSRHPFESPPLKKGDLGGFKNHQWEGIFGKRYEGISEVEVSAYESAP